MSLRMPQNIGGDLSARTGSSVLDHEMLEEKARSLAILARQLEQALARLGDAPAAPDPAREALVADAADRAWSFMIQRELCGLRDWPDVIAYYRIPPEVLVRIGAGR